MYRFIKKQAEESIEIVELFGEWDWFGNLFKKNRSCRQTDGVCENIVVCGQDINCKDV